MLILSILQGALLLLSQTRRLVKFRPTVEYFRGMRAVHTSKSLKLHIIMRRRSDYLESISLQKQISPSLWGIVEQRMIRR